MALELEYRPTTLGEVVGNKTLVTQLKASFKNPTKHSIMLTGSRGCGKTTIARILAKMADCKEVNEIDIADTRGIETAREIAISSRALSLFGGNKAYILDEVHRGTKDFFNALLKTLEEPPKHVYFFLCTTNPEQVINTVKSRCAQYEVEPLSTKETKELLNKVIKREKKEVDELAIKKIVQNSEGIPREALIMLDQIITLPLEEQAYIAEKVRTQENQVIDLCRALLANKKWTVVSKLLANIKEEPESVRRAVLGYMNSVLLKEDNQNAFLIMEAFKETFYNTGRPGLIMACYESLLE